MAVPRSLFAVGMAALAVAGQGCLMQCNHTAYGECLQPVEQAAVGLPARSKVYAFLMTGADVFDVGGMKELECELVRAGFPKIYYAQRFDEEWYYKEVHRLRRTDPDNRFVLEGRRSVEGSEVERIRVRMRSLKDAGGREVNPPGSALDIAYPDDFFTAEVPEDRDLIAVSGKQLRFGTGSDVDADGYPVHLTPGRGMGRT